MRLQTRLTLAMLALAWLPLGLSVWVLTLRTEAAFQRSFEERRGAIGAAVREGLAQAGRDLDVALQRVAQDSVLREVLLEPLGRDRFYGVQERERAAMVEAGRLMTSAAIDTLRLVDRREGGRVLAMGHRRGLAEAEPEALALLGERASEPVIRRERVEDEASGAARDVWTLQVARAADDRVALIGGRRLDAGLLAEILAGAAGAGTGGVEVAVVGSDGHPIAATFAGEAPSAGWDVGVRPLAGAGGEGAQAELRVYVSRAGVDAVVAGVWAAAAALAGVGALLALLMGLWISRRISRPLEVLAAAADRVAGGERQVEVPDPGGRDEVASLSRAFNRMTHDLADSEERLRQSERVAAWQEIARRIAHEIKNPLFPIQMSIETLQKVWKRRHPDFEEIFEESTTTILEEVARMSRIVTEFRDFARLPAPSPERVDVGELLRQVAGLHRDVDEAVTVRVEPGAAVAASVDADQVRQAMTNLVKNAVEAHQGAGPAPGAEVVLSARVHDGELQLRCDDNGPGIPPEVRERLFTPYFTTKSQGTGLGLAIVHRIVSEHRGRVRVRGLPGGGTRFELALPLDGAAGSADTVLRGPDGGGT
ncbi:MAG: HAMP domain-containing protein [Deltaproteobacteria bacterium]|nr:HAMP domain-containing protein [Deltaproteobacteria bacterium]